MTTVVSGSPIIQDGKLVGAGSNTLRKDFMIEHNLPFSNRQKMIDSINKIKNEKVELFLGNHLENNNTEKKLSILKDSKVNPFIENSQKEWDAFLETRLKLINKIIEQNL